MSLFLLFVAARLFPIFARDLVFFFFFKDAVLFEAPAVVFFLVAGEVEGVEAVFFTPFFFFIFKMAVLPLLEPLWSALRADDEVLEDFFFFFVFVAGTGSFAIRAARGMSSSLSESSTPAPSAFFTTAVGFDPSPLAKTFFFFCL